MICIKKTSTDRVYLWGIVMMKRVQTKCKRFFFIRCYITTSIWLFSKLRISRSISLTSDPPKDAKMKWIYLKTLNCLVILNVLNLPIHIIATRENWTAAKIRLNIPTITNTRKKSVQRTRNDQWKSPKKAPTTMTTKIWKNFTKNWNKTKRLKNKNNS